MEITTRPVNESETALDTDLKSGKTREATKESPRKLHIGGMVSHPEWELLNIQAGPNVDYVGDAANLSQFKDETFDELYASHVAEHFDYKDALLKTLKEWHRVLKPGGKLHISVPDMDILCQLFLKHEELNLKQRYHIMRMMFGGQMDPYDYHYVGLNFAFLAAFLKEAKFQSYERVQEFDIFDDTSKLRFLDIPISLNVIAFK